MKDKYPPDGDAVFSVTLEFICQRPKNPSNRYPRGDNDNYQKGVIDSITYAGLFWEDDIQVTHIDAVKRYQKEGEPYGIKVSVCEDVRYL